MNWIDLVAAAGIKFFLFDHFTLDRPRQWLKCREIALVNDLLDCSFCQGFWLGLGYYVVLEQEFEWLRFFGFGFASAVVSLLLHCYWEDWNQRGSEV